MTQGELVFMAVVQVFGVDGKLDAAVPNTTSWTEAQKQAVHAIVFDGFKKGLVNKNSGGNDEVALKKYIPGLVNNWVRKDVRMNGGVKYTPKNPGSRTGSGDETLKNLKALLTLVTDADAKVAVQAEIDKRLEQLKPTVTINEAAIPESLRHLLKK